MYLIFDLETNGLPRTLGYDKYYHYSNNEPYNSCRIIQISWKLLDQKPAMKELSFHTYYIRRDGFSIHNQHIHGITNEIVDQYGEDFTPVMTKFKSDLQKCEVIIAHSIQFDFNVLLNHCYRYGVHDVCEMLQEKRHFCTKSNSTYIVKKPTRFEHILYGDPSLRELYFHFFGTYPEFSHRADHDVTACELCFRKLMQFQVFSAV